MKIKIKVYLIKNPLVRKILNFNHTEFKDSKSEKISQIIYINYNFSINLIHTY